MIHDIYIYVCIYIYTYIHNDIYIYDYICRYILHPSICYIGIFKL